MIIDRMNLQDLVIESLKHLNRSSKIFEICKYVWDNYENDLISSGDIFYTWQYDIRWAVRELRLDGILKPATISPQGTWELID